MRWSIRTLEYAVRYFICLICMPSIRMCNDRNYGNKYMNGVEMHCIRLLIVEKYQGVCREVSEPLYAVIYVYAWYECRQFKYATIETRKFNYANVINFTIFNQSMHLCMSIHRLPHRWAHEWPSIPPLSPLTTTLLRHIPSVQPSLPTIAHSNKNKECRK